MSVSSESKRIEKAKLQKTLSILEIIYYNIQKSKHSDRYIVSDGKLWGVVDSEGNIIIPVIYSRITTSNDKVFRVYAGDSLVNIGFNTKTMGNLYAKYQSIFDYNGNQLIEFGAYGKIVAVENKGLIFGQMLPMRGSSGTPNTIVYVGYDGQIFEFGEDIQSVEISNHIPNLLICLKDEETLAIRFDKAVEMVDINSAFDKVEAVEADKESIENITATSRVRMNNTDDTVLNYLYNKNFRFDMPEEKFFIGTIEDTNYLLDSQMIPIIPDINGMKYKVIHR